LQFLRVEHGQLAALAIELRLIAGQRRREPLLVRVSLLDPLLGAVGGCEQRPLPRRLLPGAPDIGLRRKALRAFRLSMAASAPRRSASAWATRAR
jgi:hypothetical protein